jgi:hypothetical protein
MDDYISKTDYEWIRSTKRGARKRGATAIVINAEKRLNTAKRGN